MNIFEEKVFDFFENDVKLYYCGKRLHNYGHHFGPYQGDKLLIYYVKEGKAKLTVNGQQTELCAPAFFVNFPNSQSVYECLDGVSWSIKWMIVDGAMVERYLNLLGVTREMPFFALQDTKNIEGVFDEMYELFDKGTLSSKIYCVSLVHKLFALLAEKRQSVAPVNEYVRKAFGLIENHYADCGFNIAVLAQEMGLNANYFSVLFKRETGQMPVKVLCNYRLETACKMLKFTNRSVKDISLSCGFADELYFSRAFKKKYGISPTVYRTREGYLT